MAIPVIYKGDDTNFMDANGFSVRVEVEENLDLAGCVVVVSILGVSHKYPIEGKGAIVCPFEFSAAETLRMPLGVSCAKVRLIDPKGRTRTIIDTLRVKVVDNVQEAYGVDASHELKVEISRGGTPLPVIPEELRVTDADSLGTVKEKMNQVIDLIGGAK